MAETQTYSYAEMQRYLQRQMSPQEMHAFEKALMNDPFLADALDGFSAGDAALAGAHLAAIESSLTGDQQQAKVIPLPVNKTAWWKVAAIVLAVVSAGAVTYSVVNHSNTSDIAKLNTAAPKSQSVTPEKDSIGPADKPLARTEVLPLNQSSHFNTGSPIIHADANKSLAYQKQVNEEARQLGDTANDNSRLMASIAAAPAMQKDELTSAKQLKQTDAEVVVGYGTLRKSSMTAAPSSVAAPQNEFKGVVVNKTGEPLPFAEIKDRNSSIATISDANGNFTFKANDSVLDVSATAPGYVSAITKIKSNKPGNKISLKEDELSLSEVVVTGMSTKKKNTALAVRIDSSIAAEPVGGWKNFKQYLNRQLDSLKAIEAGEDFDEDIVLEFSIDKKGKPANIKAPAETDKTMAEKAIQILSNGPRWKNRKKDKKVKVVIALNL